MPLTVAQTAVAHLQIIDLNIIDHTNVKTKTMLGISKLKSGKQTKMRAVDDSPNKTHMKDDSPNKTHMKDDSPNKTH
jgi:hypothetical protein